MSGSSQPMEIHRMDYEGVIGLEIHAQLLTESKLFCRCPAKFGAEPNSLTCPVCLGLPGVLPVLNEKVLEFAVKTALALGCRINDGSRFARKNYFYPDLPKGYQISQFEEPLAVKGHLELDTDNGRKRIGIVRVHMEEDAGKLLHPETSDYSLVDLNRATVPLLEIVSEPDLRSPEEAAEFMKKLRSILQYLEVCDGNMEQGSLRCDANVSVRPVGEQGLGTKTELKNMNSFRHVERALAYEIKRHIKVLESGGRVIQETRLWDESEGMTLSMRGKEGAHDYRYFPEPDLPPLVVSEEFVQRVRAQLPELPDAKKGRFIQQYGIPAYDAGVLTSSRELADYYEQTVGLFPEAKTVSNWIMVELLGLLKKYNKEVASSPVSVARLATVLKMVADKAISAASAKEVIEAVVTTDRDPGDIVQEKGLKQVSDPEEVKCLIEAVLAQYPDEVQAYKGGKAKLFGFFIGEVMKGSKGKANPKVVNELLKKVLSQD
ncbi:MAG: Asp-tRNA(Asn)/Glu-tRNA(Gln) amidotransferase subunit GatB [Thermodesulfobacteriota bacterium]